MRFYENKQDEQEKIEKAGNAGLYLPKTGGCVMERSIWTDKKYNIHAPSLRGDAKTDVLVIGGGLCGVLCAHRLKQAGVDCMLVEKGRIGGGVTQHTTAKITAQHGLCYDRLIHTVDNERAAQYLAANLYAVQQYRQMARQIDCDFVEMRAGVYSRTDRGAVERELKAVHALGGKAEFAEQLDLPFAIQGAILFPDQAQFHPLKFLHALTRGLLIYENTCVRRVDGHMVYTDGGSIRAEHIIVATHFPFLNWHGSYFLKLYQQRSYVLALEHAPDIDGMYIAAEKDGYSLRRYGKYLLLGGGGHRTGKSGGGWEQLRQAAAQYFPNAHEAAHWAAQDCMSLDGMPYIGQYSKHTPGLYVASGFQKWGMTSSMVAATLLCDMVQGRDNDWQAVFSPSRSMLRPQLVVNGVEAVGNLLRPTTKRCPHMGCALRWNAQEHTWDCPCHGSRFTENGGVLDNPANRDAACLRRDGDKKSPE